MADNSVWLAIVTVTAMLSISKAVAADGKEILPVPTVPSRPDPIRYVTLYDSGLTTDKHDEL